jgi:hypothetical protein
MRESQMIAEFTAPLNCASWKMRNKFIFRHSCESENLPSPPPLSRKRARGENSHLPLTILLSQAGEKRKLPRPNGERAGVRGEKSHLHTITRKVRCESLAAPV